MIALALAQAVAEPQPLEVPPIAMPVVAPLISWAPPAPPSTVLLTLDPPAPHLPDAVRTMIVAAYKTGNDKTIADVVGLAKDNFPLFLDEIGHVADAQGKILATARHEALEKEQERIAQAGFLQIWKGELEAGASRATGSARTLGIYVSAALTRDGLRWRQKFNARIDYQRTDGQTTTERWLTAWQPNYKLSDAVYTYGLAQYEHDRFLDIDSRETAGVGIGYQAASRRNLKVTVEAGPAVRHTNFVELPSRTTLAGRASLSARWALSPTLALSQDAALFFEQTDATASSTTALETKLLGALKAKFSYNIQFERETPTTDRQLDTVTRATLVYSF